jgi:hypothetical protein
MFLPGAIFVIPVAALSAMFFEGTSARPVAAASPTLAVDMDPNRDGVQVFVTYPEGTTDVSVDIVALDVPEVGAFEFGIDVPFGVQFSAYAVGPFLGSSGRSPSCFQVPDTPESRVRIACSTLGATPPGPSGSGVLASLQLHLLGPEDACLLFSLAEISDVLGTPSTVVERRGCFSVMIPPPVTPPALVGDVDQDCRVSVLDIAKIAGSFGYSFGSLLYVPQYDLDGDQTIDIADIQMAAARFGESCPAD